MTSGMPELGSKISLISKADIRYEGRLFTVDPQECTIALASVRSFGTEDRETQYPVPAQSQVYDYILFRGSDIKDIRVVNNVSHQQPLNDPAIMQLSVPPSLGPQQFQNHPVLGHLGPQMGAPGFGGATYGGIGDLIGGGSRCTTPASMGSRKSPTNDQGVQAGGKRNDDKKMVRPIQPPGQRNQHQRKNSHERRDSRGDGSQNQNRQAVNQHRNHQNNYQGYHHHQNQGSYYQNQGYHQNNHQQGNQRGGGSQPWNMTRGPPTRQRGRPRGGFKPNQGQTNQANNKMKNTLKFENDYDFEQANTEFEELRSQLAKVKIEDGGGSTSTKSEVNGDVDKKDDSGNETGAGETEQEEEHEVFYDKTKSFFDKISCEAVERAKGKSQRTDWRTERKLNSETFGVAATRRGNYRGRGGYRGMGYRGGYRGGYRQPQQRRDQLQQGNRSDSIQKPPPQQQQLPQSVGQNSTSSTSAVNPATVAVEPAMAVK